VVIDTMSTRASGLCGPGCRSPCSGPGLVSFAVGIILGKRFSIVTMWDKWAPLYEKNLDLYRLREKCASIRSVNIPPDVESLFTGKEDEMFRR
jgi:allantoin racemase